MARSACRIDTAAAVFGRRSSCKMTVEAASTSAGAGASACSAKKRDYYTVLSLERSPAVRAAEVKRAYRRLALRYHPDACPPSRRAESTELFLELRRVYETLYDPARRVRYGAELLTAGVGTREAGKSGDFPRDVWEEQLCVLRARSERRQRARSSG